MTHNPQIIGKRHVVHTTATGAHFIVPISETDTLDWMRDSTLQVLYPRVIRGTALDGITYNEMEGFCELRENGVVTFRAATAWECERKAKKVYPRTTTARPAPVDSTVSAPQCPRIARDDWERARFRFWAVARECGLVNPKRQETQEERWARILCVSEWVGREVSSLSELDLTELDIVTDAMRRGDIVSGWMVRDETRRAA